MKAVFFVKKEEFSQAKNKVYNDDTVSKQTIIIRENSALGLSKEGYYMLIDGDEAAIKAARELLSEKAEELKDKDAEEAIAAIDKQENSAAEGFGAIFG